MKRRSLSKLLPWGILSLIVFAYACGGGGFGVGEVRLRGEKLEGGTPFENFELELLATYNSNNDSPAPVWSPEGDKLVLAEPYSGRVVVYDISSQQSEVVYSAYNTATAGLSNIQYNIYHPAFLNNNEVLTTPSWGGYLDGTDPWNESIHLDLTKGQASPSGVYGNMPRVDHESGKVILHFGDGIAIFDSDLQKLTSHRNLCNAKWDTAGEGFYALAYVSYCGEQEQNLVKVDAGGKQQILLRNVMDYAIHPKGEGAAVIRATSSSDYYDPYWSYNAIAYYDFETKKMRFLADKGRYPTFLPEAELLLFSTPDGLAVSDMTKVRILRDYKVEDIALSPDGSMLAGIVGIYNQGGYYWQGDVEIFEIKY